MDKTDNIMIRGSSLLSRKEDTFFLSIR